MSSTDVIRWREVSFFATKKLRKKWQYHVIMALKKAVRGTRHEAEWSEKLGTMFWKYPTGFDCDCMPEEGPVCCPNCGSTKMLLIRIWSKAAGVVYERASDEGHSHAPAVAEASRVGLPRMPEQMAFAF